MKTFFKQFKKINSEPLEKSNLFWSWVGSFLGILAISYFHSDILEDTDLTLGIFKFKHTAWPEYLTWMGFTVSNSNDNSDQIKKEGGWLDNQWGTMAKGGANGAGSPFLVSFADHKPSEKALKYGEEVKIEN